MRTVEDDAKRSRFEEEHAKANGLKSVYETSRIAIPCECGDSDCRGFQMLARDEIVNICLAAREFVKTKTPASLEDLKRAIWSTRSLP